MPLVGERIVTTLSLSCHSTVTGWGKCRCSAICDPMLGPSVERGPAYVVLLKKQFISRKLVEENSDSFVIRIGDTANLSSLICKLVCYCHFISLTSLPALVSYIISESLPVFWASRSPSQQSQQQDIWHHQTETSSGRSICLHHSWIRGSCP